MKYDTVKLGFIAAAMMNIGGFVFMLFFAWVFLTQGKSSKSVA